MIEQKAIDRVLRMTLVVFMLLAVGFLVRHVILLELRQTELVQQGLQRTQQMLHIRLDATFNEWGEDLREEAAAVANADSTSASHIWQRWVPLLRSHWAILSVRLADERGNELAVHRKDSTLELVGTTEGSKSIPPHARRIITNGMVDTLALPWSEYADYDPRERIWFSKALENDRDVPVWSLRQFGDTAVAVLQVSYMIRGREIDEPFRVLMFDVELERNEAMDAHSATPGAHSCLMVASNLRLVPEPGLHSDPGIRQATERLRTMWSADQQKRSFRIEVGSRSFAALVEPYRLNGLSLHSAVLLDIAPIVAWTAADQRVEWTSGIMLGILFILLAGLWWRGRQRMNAIRQQAKQTRNQARKLDKVIGTSLNDGPVREEFLRGKRRIDTIALVHHKLYGLADLRNVDLAGFFAQLIEALASMHRPQSATVSTSVDTAGIKCDQDTAIELGIILCELVTNAYQHAFPYASGGHVEVVVSAVEGDLHRLMVRNNGVALPEQLSSGPGKLGLEIVDALAGQLDGSFHVRSDGGVTFEVLFRMRRPTVDAPVVEE
ncbi:MAG: sensor histidine kinase [Flavobacteriales bacterium]|nr:sensor histidine kinase [Flavobacteriales bacterium]